MSAELLPVWSEIEKYIDAGISVIPVRDKDDSFGVAKSPFGKSWKEYQEKIIEKDILFYLMDVKYETTAIGIVGGKVSGNLEIIDIDVKYKPGIDATLFQDIKTLYPSLLDRLRIHKSPSGGFHILYRCEEPVEGNQKLAGRKTEVDNKTKTVNFIETRGEGGYVLAPPSLGYLIAKDNPIPTLTAMERQSLLSLCRSYHEIIEVKNSYTKPTQKDVQYYDTNPFEDFNNRCNPTEIMTELGWKEHKANNHFIWYTRPGKKTGVSMSFNLVKRFFFCFTASTELEEHKGYTPSNLLAAIVHNGDKKKLYSDLVKRGFGVIKPEVERKIAKSAAINKKGLPANVSSDALKAFDEITAELDERHPFGLFWVDSIDKGVLIDRELLYGVAGKLGFMLWHGKLIQSDGRFIEMIEERFFFDALKEYVQEEDASLYRDICNAYEAFIEKHGRFTISRLPILEDKEILSDTKEAAYKCYLNGILRITVDAIDLLDSVPLLIWKHSIQEREYKEGQGGAYIEFLKLATDYKINKDYLLLCIGYLAHEYKDETAGYIIVLTEQCENPKDGGGAGKNVFSNLFRHTTSVASKPGEQIKYDEKFMQSWNYQKIFCISDAPKNFNFSFLKELSTGMGLMKKLFKDESEIPVALMPKFLIQTNYSIEIKDGGLARRVKIIEFTDFFTRAGGIDVYFGTHFPNEWKEEDWNGYDTTIANAIKQWLRAGRKIGEAPLSETGWMKQFEHTWGPIIISFIKESFSDWVFKEWVSNDEFKRQLEAFHRENNTPHHYQPSSFRINRAIKEYCDHKGVQYLSDVERRENGIKSRYRWFGSDGRSPF